MRAGVLRNPRSHRNDAAVVRARGARPDDTVYAELSTPEALPKTLATFAADGVRLLVIDGGDGTIRDVLSLAPEIFGFTPLLAIVPSGKTNALALDLGVRPGWTAESAIASARAHPHAVKQRSPLEIRSPARPGQVLRGFILGTSMFARATALAQRAHAAGLVDSTAVGLTIAAAVVRTLIGGPRDPWRVGEPHSVALDGEAARTGARFMVLATTLKRFPLRLRPFGRPSDGLKVLDIDAPPKRLWMALAPLVFGFARRWLSVRGYRRNFAQVLRLDTSDSFVLDGEFFAGGDLAVRRGEAFSFVVPPGRRRRKPRAGP